MALRESRLGTEKVRDEGDEGRFLSQSHFIFTTAARFLSAEKVPSGRTHFPRCVDLPLWFHGAVFIDRNEAEVEPEAGF